MPTACPQPVGNKEVHHGQDSMHEWFFFLFGSQSREKVVCTKQKLICFQLLSETKHLIRCCAQDVGETSSNPIFIWFRAEIWLNDLITAGVSKLWATDRIQSERVSSPVREGLIWHGGPVSWSYAMLAVPSMVLPSTADPTTVCLL